MLALDALLCVPWVWALRAVIAAWHDPGAKLLRFSSLGVLFLYIPVIVGILSLAFHA